MSPYVPLSLAVLPTKAIRPFTPSGVFNTHSVDFVSLPSFLPYATSRVTNFCSRTKNGVSIPPPACRWGRRANLSSRFDVGTSGGVCDPF